MQRVIAAIAALGLALLLPARAGALALAYDVAGHGGTIGVPFAFDSTIAVELDRNGDGVNGDVALTYRTSLNTVTEQRAGFSVFGFQDFYVVTGATGTLSGHEIFWDAGHTTVTHTRFSYCTGPYCAVAGLPAYAPSPTLDPSYSRNPDVDLGYWLLSDDLTRILGSTIAVFSTGSPDPGGSDGQPLESFVFGDAVLPRPPVPEPDAAALLVVALAAIVAVQRAATAR